MDPCPSLLEKLEPQNQTMTGPGKTWQIGQFPWTQRLGTTFEEELSLRQIKIKNGSDIIHWGSRGEGTFKVKYAYIRAVDLSEMDKRKDWQRIWQPGIWPKIVTFLWLILTKKVLTWDKLRKRGYEGPSICMLCREEEETLNHLFCTCREVRNIWDNGAMLFHRARGGRDDTTNLIIDWLVEPFKNPILNKTWEIFPGIVMWNLWKERNKIIFKQNSLSTQFLWNQIKENVQETIASSTWSVRR
jgi:hypothetical protein